MFHKLTSAAFAASALLTCLSAAALAPDLGKGARAVVPIAVVVAAQSTLHNVSHALLRRIFMGEPTEHEGVRLVPLNYGPEDPMRVGFDELALGWSSGAAGRYWVDRRIRGQGLAPRVVPTQKLMRAVVARLPGAIGYLSSDQLDRSVRAVSVDDLSYDDAAYPLKLRL